MKINKLIIIIIMATIFITVSTPSYHTHASTYSEVSELIETIEGKIIDTFIVLSQAENAGADVSSILKKLSLIIDDINEVKYGLFEEHTEISINDMQTFLDSVNEISAEALQLKNTAIALQEETRRNRLFYTALRTTLFVLIMYGFWYYYKSYQTKKLLGYKPEVV
ncbi:hypothetical protein ACFL0D_02730 [Thermoproteota archaeon]